MFDPVTAFDQVLRQQAPTAESWPEGEDRTFAKHLHIACSTLAGMLPPAILQQQADLQYSSHRAAFPAAMRQIIGVQGVPAGRIMVDWGSCHLVDIAVLPEFRGQGLGLAMLQAYIAVAEQLGRACTLTVMSDNPAQRIYQRLGFVPHNSDEFSQMAVEMIRPAR